MERQYKITESRLRDLLSCEAQMEALGNMGVDNWCGYGECEWGGTEDEDMDLTGFKVL